MSALDIMTLISTFMSSFNFMAAMLVIVLISACFLGRYIVITRKMVIATFGVIIFQVLMLVVVNFYFKYTAPDFYEFMDNMSAAEAVSPDSPFYDRFIQYSFVASAVLNGFIFLYAFVFYLIAYKEKKILRAIEAEICLYLFYYYVNTMIEYTYVYIKGGNIKTLYSLVDLAGGKDQSYFTILLVAIHLVLLTTMLLVLYFGYFKKKRFYVVSVLNRILFVVWLVVFSIFPGMAFYSEVVEEQYKMLSFIFGILIPIMGFLAPLLLVMNAAEKNLKEKNEYQETYLNAELEYIEQYKRTQESTRAFRHDIINNLSLTNMMLDEGKTEEASEHLKQLLGNVKALSPSIITGDEMLDCIVAMKAEKMKELEIDFKTDGVVDGGLHMKPMDVCSIFANALDNAIEASRQIEENPWVEMNIKRTEKFFVIKVSNAAKSKVDVEKLFMSSGYTSKKDKEHHGFGLRNIRQSVDDYDGLVKAESEEGMFALSIMIPRK